ncbi:hypothetical protein HMPREF1576_01071 [Gardnerella pickettii JCP7719]|uniref:Uncharacterized protein n=1 Tax=Gardnerella pickettii JCP7719 TaxID=1261061 RepID=S4H2X6_9BIFI|nr:hypothetical protein HMPREF1576_01071 [Gardnerella pickettii JCP7719]
MLDWSCLIRLALIYLVSLNYSNFYAFSLKSEMIKLCCCIFI